MRLTTASKLKLLLALTMASADLILTKAFWSLALFQRLSCRFFGLPSHAYSYGAVALLAYRRPRR